MLQLPTGDHFVSSEEGCSSYPFHRWEVRDISSKLRANQIWPPWWEIAINLKPVLANRITTSTEIHLSKCPQSQSTRRISGNDSVRNTVCSFQSASWATSDWWPATEEFDKLCFEFGVELDEDVGFSILDCYKIAHSRHYRPLKRSRLQPGKVYPLSVL